MMLLDTSFLIDYFKGVQETKDLIGGEEVCTTVINYHEIMAGVKRIRARREESFFRRLFSRIRVLECDLKAVEESSNIAVKLAMIGREINALDVLIAGIALANGVEKIATKDRHFTEIEKVADIKVITY